MSGKTRNGTALRFEALEPRMLLAGDVLVAVVDGDLVISGDELGNAIEIMPGDEAGEYVIIGRDTVSGDHLGPTTINGDAQPLVVTGVTGDFTISMDCRPGTAEMYGADDCVTLTGRSAGSDDDSAADVPLVVPGDLIVDVHYGDNTVDLNSVNVGGDATIKMGIGDDGVHMVDVSVVGDMIIDTLYADDIVDLRSLQVGGDVRVETGTEDDIVTVHSVIVSGDLRIHAGLDYDSVDLY